MTRALLLLAALCGGCFVVPTTKTTTRPLGTEYGPTTLARVIHTRVVANVDGAEVSIHAAREGVCARPVYAIDERVRTRKARLGGADDPRAFLFSAVLAPITIPVSALITGIIVAADSPHAERVTRHVRTESLTCSQSAAALPITLTLPSGASASLVTDREGRATFTVPGTEPYAGTLELASAGVAPQSLAYALPKPAVTAARDAVLSCSATHGLTGSVTLRLTISEGGRVSRLWLSAGDAAAHACVEQQLASVRFPTALRARSVAIPLSVPAPVVGTR